MKRESAGSIHERQSAFSFVPVKRCPCCKQDAPEPNFAYEQWLAPDGECRACIKAKLLLYTARHESAIEGLGQHLYFIERSRRPRAMIEQELRARGYEHRIIVCRLDTPVHYLSPQTCAVDYRELWDGFTMRSITPELLSRIVSAIDAEELPEASPSRTQKLKMNAELRLQKEEQYV